MASDSQVSARLVMQSLLELQRQGSRRVMATLEELEPDLIEYVLENLTAIYHELLDLGGAPKASRRVYAHVQAVVLVSIIALRKSHYELWRQTASGSRLAQLDPSLGATPSPSPDSGSALSPPSETGEDLS